MQTAHAEALRVTSETKNAHTPVVEATAFDVIVPQKEIDGKWPYKEPYDRGFREAYTEYSATKKDEDDLQFVMDDRPQSVSEYKASEQPKATKAEISRTNLGTKLKDVQRLCTWSQGHR